jgi:hypothetical protein
LQQQQQQQQGRGMVEVFREVLAARGDEAVPGTVRIPVPLLRVSGSADKERLPPLSAGAMPLYIYDSGLELISHSPPARPAAI